MKGTAEKMSAKNAQTRYGFSGSVNELAVLIEELDIIFKNTSEAIFLTMVEGDEFRYVRNNKAHERLSGFSLDHLRGKTPPELMGEEAGRRINEHYREVIKKKQLYSFEEIYSFPTGEKTLQVRLSPVEIEGQIKYIVGTSVDITGQREAEKSLEKTKQELQREKDLLYTTLRSIGEGVIATDINGRITYLNKAAEMITGWSMQRDRDRLFTDFLEMVSEVSGQSIADPVKYVLKTGMALRLDAVLLRTNDGSLVPIAYKINPITDENNTVIGVVMVFRDLSREKEQTEKINYLNYHDLLTGLYNRRFMEEQIQLLDNAGQLPLAIIIGDLNGLKLSNDVFGYEEGDRLLQRAAATLREICPPDAVLGRWGGDEFLALIPRTSLSEAEKIMQAVKSNTYTNNTGRLRLSISMGCSAKEQIGECFTAKLKEAEEWMYQQKLTKGKSYRNSIISAMLATLFEKSNETEEHAQRLKYYCSVLGSELKCSGREMQQLAVLAMLHDIGKIGISESILQKPGSLTDEEWREMRKHPEIGYRIASNINELVYVAENILHHHERWDGEGYPDGLAGKEIPLVCRILAVADSYDAMTNTRVYRAAMSREAAIRELKLNAGTQFDPRVIEVFLNILAREAAGEKFSDFANLLKARAQDNVS